jgi:hypothetical protein
MRSLWITIIAAALTGCAAQVIDSNPRSVTIKAPTAQTGKAIQAAQAECQKHGRNARLNVRDGMNWHFDCT